MVADVRYVKPSDSFRMNKIVCDQLLDGVYAIFGPPVGQRDIISVRTMSGHVQSICNALDIPHLEASIDDGKNKGNTFSINLHPTANQMSAAFADVIRFLNWTDVAIIYERTEDNSNGGGLIRLSDLMNLKPKLNIHVLYADRDTFVNVLEEIKHLEFHNVIIDTRPGHIGDVLKAVSGYHVFAS